MHQNEKQAIIRREKDKAVKYLDDIFKPYFLEKIEKISIKRIRSG